MTQKEPDKSDQARTSDHNEERTNRKTPPSLTLDVKRYEHLLEDEDIPEEQRRELYEVLWNLVTELVLMGFEIHPLQTAEAACGKSEQNSEDSPLLSPDVLDCDKQTLTDNFKIKTELETASEKQGVLT